MYDYDSPISHSDFQSPFRDREDLKSLTVTEGITSIGDYAFENTGNLVSATFPKTLKTFGKSSFMYADNYTGPVYGLSTLHIPENVTTLKSDAFLGTQLTDVVVPASVKTVGSQVFGDCSQLVSVRYEAEEVGEELFTRCISLSSLTLAHSVKKLGARIFPYCESLHTIPERYDHRIRRSAVGRAGRLHHGL